MEDKKLFELRLELKDITGAPNGKTSLKIEIGEVREQIDGKGFVIAKLAEIAITTTLQLSLFQGEKSLGTSSVSLGTLLGKGLISSAEKWIRLKNEKEVTNIKLKIFASMSRNDKIIPKILTPQSGSSQHSRRASRNMKDTKCPYLEKLAQNKDISQEALDEIWKIRRISGETEQVNSIKISLEPDSPAKIDAGDSEFQPPSLDELTIEKLQSFGGSQLKQIVKALCEEAKHLSVIATQLPVMRVNLTQNIEKRRELEVSSQSETEGFRDTWTLKEKDLHELQQKKKNLMNVLIEKQENARKLENDLDGLRAQCGDLKREGLKLQAEKEYRDDVKRELEEFENLAQESAEEKAELKLKVEQAQFELNEAHQRNQHQIELIAREKSLIKTKLEEVTQRFEEVSAKNSELKKNLLELKAKIENHEEVELNLRNGLTTFHIESSNRDEIQKRLQVLIDQLKQQTSEIKLRQLSLLESKQELSHNLSNLESNIESKEQEVIDLRRQLYKASCKKITLEQICCIRADLSQMIEDLTRLHSLHLESRDVILRDLESGASFLVNEGQKIHDQAQKLDHLIDAVDGKDRELDSLKSVMGEIKKRNPPYVPVKDDQVDIALSEFLNNRQIPVPVQFVRTDPGNYNFGTRKIYIKIENSRLLVRIGGGFTGMEEFVDIYTPIELERLDSQAPKAGLLSLTKVTSGRKSQDASPGLPQIPAAKMISVFEALANSPAKKK